MMNVTDFHSRTTPILSESRNDVSTYSPTNHKRKRSIRNSEPTTGQRSRSASHVKTPAPSKDCIRKLWRQLNLDILKTGVMIAEVNLKQAKLQLLEEDCFDEEPSQNKRVRREDGVAPNHRVDKDYKESFQEISTHSEANQSMETGNQLQNNPVLSQTDRRRRIEVLEKELQHLKKQEHLSELPLPKHITSSLQTIEELVCPLPRQAVIAGTSQMFHLSLPEFSGGYDDWLKYKAAYDSTQQNYNDIINVERIKKSLSGEALKVNMMNKTNPKYIMRKLEKKFGRPKNIVYAESKKLLALPVCTESAVHIHKFASKIKDTLNKFKALNVDWYIINPDLLENLKDKLPPSLRLICSNIATDNPTVDLTKFVEFLDKHVDARMNCKGKPLKETKSAERPVKGSHDLNDKISTPKHDSHMLKETQ